METHSQTHRVWGVITIRSLLIWLLTAFIRAYQYLLSPWLGHRCRFTPSCSEYALEAIQTHGPLCGVGLSARRLCKCHPWHSGGFDPVPKNSISEN